MLKRTLMIGFVILFVAGVLTVPSYAEIDTETIVGYWNFDEGAGKVAKDSSVNKFNGELMGSPKWVGGKIGKALEFDGIGDYIEVSDIITPGFATFACWFKKTGPGSGGVPRIHSGGGAPWSIEYGIGNTHQSNQLQFYFAFQDGSTAGWLPFFEPKEDIWYHTAISYDGTWVIAYVDGKEVYSSQDWAGKKLNQDISRLGGGGFQGGQWDFFQGVIDEPILFNVALKEEDVKNLMSGKWASVEPSGKLTTTWSGIKAQ